MFPHVLEVQRGKNCMNIVYGSVQSCNDSGRMWLCICLIIECQTECTGNIPRRLCRNSALTIKSGGYLLYCGRTWIYFHWNVDGRGSLCCLAARGALVPFPSVQGKPWPFAQRQTGNYPLLGLFDCVVYVYCVKFNEENVIRLSCSDNLKWNWKQFDITYHVIV